MISSLSASVEIWDRQAHDITNIQTERRYDNPPMANSALIGNQAVSEYMLALTRRDTV